MIQNWNIGLPYAFPPFSIISRVFLKIKEECVSLLILIVPAWSTKPWYPEFLNLCVREPVLLPQGQGILIRPKNIVHPLVVENSLTLAAWLVWKSLLCEGISENASHIIPNFRRKGTLSNYESGRRKWAGWCFERKIDPF